MRMIRRKHGLKGNVVRGMSVSLIMAVAVMAVFLLGFSDTAAARDSVVRFGGNVVVQAHERIVGEVAAIGGAVEVLGEVLGDVFALGGSVTVEGTVSGDVVAVGGTITLGPTARISGDVIVVGGSINRDPSALVFGEVTAVTMADSFRLGWSDWGWTSWQWTRVNWPVTLLYVAGLFALAALVLAWIPDRVHAVEAHMESNAGRSVVIGLLAVILLVPLSLLLVLTIVGVPLLWLGFFAAKMLGYVALVGLVGRKVTERFAPESAAVWQLVAGVAIVAVLRYVPVVGGLFSLVATVWTLGAVLDTKFGSNRPWLPPKQA